MTRRILLIALASAAAACSDNRSSVEIVGRAFPDSVPSCKYTTGGTQLIGEGQLDVTAGVQRTYGTVFQVNNTMVDPSKANPATVAAAKAWRALAAKIRVNPSDYMKDFPPSPDLLAFSRDARVPLDGTTIEPNGNGTIEAQVVDSTLGDAIFAALGGATSAHVVVGVTLEGQTLDGHSLDSGEWYFGLRVCTGAGCLYPTCKAGDVLEGCFPGSGDPIVCVTP